MGVQIQGFSGIVAEVDASFRAQRASARPLDHGALGHYRIAAVTGTLAAALAANAVVFSARWAQAASFAVITRLRTRFLPLTPFTAATLASHTSFDAFVGRSFSAAHTGGTALTLTGNNQKMRASMGASLWADIRISTTGALGGGTITPDAQAFAMSLRTGNRVNPAAATEEVIQPTTDGMDADFDVASGEHPLVIGNNEGIIVRNRTVWPAAGTGILKVEMTWTEVAAY